MAANSAGTIASDDAGNPMQVPLPQTAAEVISPALGINIHPACAKAIAHMAYPWRWPIRSKKITQLMMAAVNREGVRKAIWSKCTKSITATFRDVKCLCLILKHPDTPWRVRIVLFFPVAYVCSPIQLFPNFIPVLGQLDDLFMIWAANQLMLRLVSENIRRECRETVGRPRMNAADVLAANFWPISVLRNSDSRTAESPSSKHSVSPRKVI
jgi:uncharacterized membrane protein YkvA (DUF1232 family)